MSSDSHDTVPHHPPPYSSLPREPARSQQGREEWEDWEDDETIITPIDTGEQVLIEPPPQPTTSTRSSKTPNPRSSRVSIVRVKRLKSRHRQKAQNAKAGIRLITDMSAFRRQNHIAEQLRTPDGRPVKFVDAAALKALEGEPTSASVGSWNWLKRNKTDSPASATPKQLTQSPDQDLSPEDRRIMIGIALPSDELSEREFSPQTATVDTPMPAPNLYNGSSTVSAQTSNSVATPVAQQKSVWSPDTPDTASSWGSSRVTSSIYSQVTVRGMGPANQDVPPVPALPANYKKTPQQRLISLELGNTLDDDDNGSPCTLFEEDGIPSPQRQQGKGKSTAITPDSAGSRSHGWWDHVVTPFMEKRLTLASRKQRLESPKEKEEDEWWNGSDAKEARPQYLAPKPSPVPSQPPIVKTPVPRRSPSPRPSTPPVVASGPSSARSSPALDQQPMSEKSQAYFSNATTLTDHPPPYSPPKKETVAAVPVRFRAVFPPGHPLNAQFPPSPGPASPGLAATMTSQGATPMTEIPLTPAPRTGTPLSQVALPNRPLGTFVPQEHSHAASGPANSIERQRRRHEKEEVIARRFGGLWRGRGCIPKSGCFGRTGREGRQRRRVWMAVWSAIIAIIILVIVLAVVLTRPKDLDEAPSIWVNLTDFPPMPTGVLTVVGPDNTVSRSGCTEPSTMWSCALPKEQHESVEPYKPNQPTVIMQIQWDNGTRETWNKPNGDPPVPLSRRMSGAAAYAGSLLRKRQTDDDFKPVPSPPDFKEMWFLGNTTDDVQSDDKGGEPTPFYISLLDSVDDEIKSDKLARRQDNVNGNISLSKVLPDPDLNEDGTPKPAVLLPQPVQQPVRLYDRGLPTEHYGFYTYFKRTIFLKSVTVLNETDEDEGDVPLDENGGSRETEADFIATWAETRLLVRIWTRTLDANTSSLLGEGTSIDGSEELNRPGTMPYPVTVTLDTHGGDPTKKFVWAWPMDDRQQVDVDGAKLLANDMSVGGTWVNKRSRGDEKFGGFDGGTGGCKCEWVNWIQTRSAS